MSSIQSVVVTGSSGRIGSRLVQSLAGAGYQVIGLDQKPPQAEFPGRFQLVNLTDRQAVRQALTGADAICHLGEIPNVSRDRPHEVTYATNCTIGSNMLMAAAELGVKRFIYTSTCQVYGTWSNPGEHLPPKYVPVDEDHPFQPVNAYAASKVANETFAGVVSRRTGLPVAIFRLPWVIFEQPGNTERRRQHLETEDSVGDGLSTGLWVEDAVQAYLGGLRNIHPGCRAYHFTAADVPGRTPIRERVLAKHPHLTIPEDWPRYRALVNLERARVELGWSPTRRFQDAYDALGVDRP